MLLGCMPSHSPAKGRTELTKETNCWFIMKTLVVLSLFLAVSMAQSYTDKFDNINIDEILESNRLLKGYVDCLLDKGRCTPDGKELKDNLPDALQNDCSKCTQKQKINSDKVIKHFVNKRQDLWKQLAVKYDPENIYQQKYKDKIQAVKE